MNAEAVGCAGMGGTFRVCCQFVQSVVNPLPIVQSSAARGLPRATRVRDVDRSSRGQLRCSAETGEE